MASTNKTTNYELSQFQSSDIPAWLTDYNGDMQKIDAGIHAAKVLADGAASGVSALQTTVSGKQDKLTFDSAPLSGSSNPVTSGGIYTALQNVNVQTDAVPTSGSTKAVQSGGVYDALQNKQNKLTFDSEPTQGSTNPVTSGGVYTAIQGVGGTFNAYGDFKDPILENTVPSLRYLYNNKNGLLICFSSDGFSISILGSRWTVVADAAFPSYQKLFYIDGNPFGLTGVASFPTTQQALLNASARGIGGASIPTSTSSTTGVYLKIIYISGENRTYIYAQANYPATSNETLRLCLIGDLSHE